MTPRAHVPWRSIVVALARVANAGFFLLTATYCLLTYNPFAYQQLIRPHLINWLGDFVVWHHLAFWAALGVTTLTMLRELPLVKGRAIGLGYLAASCAVGVALLVQPVLPQVENNGRGLVLALVALIPPIWLAVYDHRVTSGAFSPAPSSDRRVVKAMFLAALVVWVEQTAAVPWRLGQTGEIRLEAPGIALGIVTSAIGHLVVFTMLVLCVIAALRLGGRAREDGTGEYWALVGLSGVMTTLVAGRLVFGAISFLGGPAWGVSILLGVAIALLWSGIARRLHVEAGVEGASAVEAWLAPLPGRGGRLTSMAALVALAFVSYGVVAQVMTFDWDFLLQRIWVLALWLLAFGYSFGALRGDGRRVTWRQLAVPALGAVALLGVMAAVQPRLARWMGTPRFVPEFVLEGYLAVDPSYRVVQDLLHVPSAEDAAFYSFLRAHSALDDATIKPVEIDFVRPLGPSARTRPHIFLFVVDSLRPDYLSAYNPKVRFTPSISRFAADSVVFERTFTRYGGTGLSMPAMWTGGMLIHKQYVTPFAPMNALEKLLDANGYRKVLSLDHITEQILKPAAAVEELDRGRPEMQYDLCGTLGELADLLERGGARPVFAHTRSLNLHIAHVRSFRAQARESYKGFVAPVAAVVERLDGCFGTFVDFLRRAGLYDDSIIVLTSDHGDTLGESLRWGHSYTLYPEVVRIPLIVHVPALLKDRLSADPDAIALSTDITPTLYALLGYTPMDLGPLFGNPLFAAGPTETASRRQRPHLIASSYGAVYGVLRENGRFLYVADGVNSLDYAYELAPLSRERIGITPERRRADRAFIREQLEALARLYDFEPRP